MLELMQKRRSIRKFTPEPVSPQDRDKLIKAALLAPSSRNLRSVELVVIDDREMIRGLADCKAMFTTPLETATMLFVVAADSEKTDIWPQDAAIVCTHLLLEAEYLDLGACWVHIHNRTDQVGRSSEEAVRSRLGIPEKYGVLALIAVGHKDERKPAYTDEQYDFSKVHEGKF